MYQSASSRSGESSPTNSTTYQNHDGYYSAAPPNVTNAVHSLLTSTKKLQQVLKLWSIEQASETDVSDLYVQIGHELNHTISAFAHYQIDVSEIHTIPAELRDVLEHCLSEEPSPEVVESFMPELRQVLYKLLKGLQSRRDVWKAAVRQQNNPYTQPLSPRSSR
ncbi:hypothetical protein CVT24_011378 [Panaeolus cyanescens]|uniref:Aip3p/Bud6 N-terminal domain-containing protein n=1 Tax=Panaeolus cyanescens TaxID=181874 RepID=A0A409VG11_9AGAR|nr:hypothetical protein CVT24_011378 [Panaeolus cyanescens]